MICWLAIPTLKLENIGRWLTLVEEETNTQRKFADQWSLEDLENRLNPLAAEQSSFEAYTGQFGPRKIFIRDGDMYYQRGEGTAYRLQAMADKDRFMVGELNYFRLLFERDQNGEISGVTGQYDNGRADRNNRSDGW